MKFFKCEKCGKIISALNEKPCPTMCCGEEMKEMTANSTDAAGEKHVPVYKVNGNIVEVTVGSVPHPMEEAHFIQWVALETEQGNQRKVLKPGQEPKVTFAMVDGDKVKNVYEYCNLHGLWKA